MKTKRYVSYLALIVTTTTTYTTATTTTTFDFCLTSTFSRYHSRLADSPPENRSKIQIVT